MSPETKPDGTSGKIGRTMPRFSDAPGGPDATSLELREAVGRTRTILGVGLVLWGLGGLSDLFIGTSGHAPLAVLLGVRAGFFVIALLVYARLRQPTLPSDRNFELLSGALYFSATFALGIYALAWGGIASPAGHGVAAVLCVRAVGRPLPVRRGLLSMFTSALGYPAALALGAAFSPDVAAQFTDPSALGGFGMQSLLTAATAGILAVGGDTTWTLKQRLFATRVVGRYRLDEKLGQGGMGEVWRAYHPALRKHVAVKILKSELAQSGGLSRFDREIGAMTELSHPHTVRVFDAGQTDDGLYFYAMELLPGRTLAELVEKEGPLAPSRAVRMVRQAARAITEAHDKGLIHRDLKPENLFVCNLGGEPDFIKVLDFGIAKLLGAGQMDFTQTREDMVIGTPAYMPPEQCLGRPVDARSDVYALGSVLFFALTGTAPFGFEPIARVLSAQVTEPPPDVVPLMPWKAPRELADVVARSLAKAPEDRFPTMHAFEQALEALGESEDVRVEPPTSPAVQGSADTLVAD